MKKGIILILTILMLLPMLLSCSFTEEAPQNSPVYDSFNIPPEHLEAVKKHPDDVAIRCVQIIHPPYEKFSCTADVLTSLEKVKDYYDNEEEQFFYIRSAKDGSIYIRSLNTSDGTVKPHSEDPVYYGKRRYLCFELLDHPEKFFPKDTVIEECYFFGGRGNWFGSFAYVVTNQGEMVAFSRYGDESEDPIFVFPKQAFNDALDRYAKWSEANPDPEILFGGYYDLYTVLKILKTDLKSSDFTAPFDIDRYERRLVEERIQKVLLFGGIPTVVLAVAVVITTKKRKKKRVLKAATPEITPEPQSPAPQDE